MLIKENRTSRATRRARRPRHPNQSTGSIAAPSCAGRARRRRPGGAGRASARLACARRRPVRRRPGRHGHDAQEHLHALRGRLHRDRRSLKRRVDRPGAGWDSPFNRGSHCAKGAAVRELVMGERRLKYPMKLVNGQWTRITWDQAIDEIGDKLLDIREKSGPDSVYWLGSAKIHQRRRLSVPQVCAPSGAPTTTTIRRASAIRPPSPAWPIPGAMAR